MSSRRQDTGSAIQRPLTAHHAADADGCTTSSRGEQPVLPGAVDRVLRHISQASAAERVMPGALLDGHLAALWTVARTGSRLQVSRPRVRVPPGRGRLRGALWW